MTIKRAIDLVGGFVASFHPRTLPPMLRANYARELVSWMFLPVMLGAVEGGTISIIVKKAFASAPGVSPAALNLAVAVVTAAPAVANITSFVWATFSHGRPKIRFIAWLQIATALLVALIAATPHSAAGLVMLTTLVVLARVTWTGVITIRTTVWGANYPRADRARIAGKMATVQSAALSIVGVVLGTAMDWNERSFHWLFPLCALVGLLGNAIYRRVRLRGQRRLARAERCGRAEDRPTLNPASVARVLRNDPLYRRFMLWLFVFGLGNLMLSAPLAIVLNDGFHVTYIQGILITSAIPTALMPFTIPMWSKLLDRCHVVEFRAIHGWSFVAVSLLQFLGAAFGVLSLFFAAAVGMGIAFGGGVLAWNLGHHDFAPPNRDAQYMGVHVTLTGLRGLLAPFLAVGIYDLLDRQIPGSGGGFWVFGVCLALNLVGAIGFVHLKRQMASGQFKALDGAAAH
ncbi:MAG: MFS transporter [Phycisphaerales bacterium]|nr:MFS transporter [Phycisphaerales bacterium]